MFFKNSGFNQFIIKNAIANSIAITIKKISVTRANIRINLKNFKIDFLKEWLYSLPKANK